MKENVIIGRVNAALLAVVSRGSKQLENPLHHEK